MAGDLCPSGRCAPGSQLLGIVSPDGTVAYLRPTLPVDEEFVEAAERGRDPGARFRFAEPCAEAGCGHWGGQRCTLIDRILTADAAGSREDAALPHCGIRSSCRWFAQRGRDACVICPLVVRSPHPEPSSAASTPVAPR